MEKLTFGKDPSEMHETSSLTCYRNDYCKAQHLGELFFCRLVVGCASAILIVMWPLGLAFMLTL